MRLPVETRTGPRSALGWASERTASQSNLAEPDGVTYRPSLPRHRFAEATRQDGCRLERRADTASGTEAECVSINNRLETE